MRALILVVLLVALATSGCALCLAGAAVGAVAAVVAGGAAPGSDECDECRSEMCRLALQRGPLDDIDDILFRESCANACRACAEARLMSALSRSHAVHYSDEEAETDSRMRELKRDMESDMDSMERRLDRAQENLRWGRDEWNRPLNMGN